MKNSIERIIQKFSEDVRILLKDNLVHQYLFGSFAKNDLNSDSDIDILIIVKQLSYDLRKAVSGLASEYSLQYDIHISPIVKEVEVWEKNKYFHTLFYREVEQDGILL